MVLNDGLLIFAIVKIHKFIKLQANTEIRKTQFTFAISIVCVAFLSSCLTFIDFFVWSDALDRWTVGIDHLTEFLLQITILGFCWVYATRPRTQLGNIEDADIEDD